MDVGDELFFRIMESDFNVVNVVKYNPMLFMVLEAWL